MAHSVSKQRTGRIHHRRFYHWRTCRFEPLEVRQVLSAASTVLDALAALGPMQGSINVSLPRTHVTSSPTGGFTPAQIRQAYGFNNITFPGGKKADGTGTTIAIIDPGYDPTIVADLKAFDAQFGIPDPPSFKIVNQYGSSNPATFPISDPYTSVEIALDVEWAHAIAPGANILLVEVNDPFSPNSFGSLDPTFMYLGNLYARSVPGVNVISNSWGGGEFIGESANDALFVTPAGHTGVQWVFSAGDDGGPAGYPSASPNVLSVGGTSLKLTASNNISSEVVWNDSVGSGGGGQSAALFQDAGGNIFSAFPIEGVPNYQSGLGLVGRGTPDVSFNAVTFDVYDSFSFGAATPWGVVYGTSAGAPQWSALIAIADQGRKLAGKPSLSNVQSIIYKLPAADFHDTTIGNNDFLGFGLGITGNAAHSGYDLATGRGSPIANLVIRDLVAFNGSTFVSSTRAAVSNSSGSWFFYAKPSVLTADLGSQFNAPTVASPIQTNATIIASGSSLPNSLSTAPAGGDQSAPQSDSLHFNDPALQFAADSNDSPSLRSHRSRGSLDIEANHSEAALDRFFAQM